MKKSLFFLLFLQLVTIRDSAAVTLFQDNFNSYANSAAFHQAILNGSSGWEAVRFQAPADGSILSDIGVSNLIPFGQGQFAVFADNAGIMFQVSTEGLTEAMLSFDWRTVAADYTDYFAAGYFVGDLPTDSDHTTSFVANGNPWWHTDWTSIVYSRSTASRSIVDYLLPVGEASLWIAFWYNDRSCDRIGVGLLDNVRVTGSEVPEPATAMLLGSALVAFRLRRRRG